MTNATSSGRETPRKARASQRAVRLRIVGADLLLNGRFGSWHSTLTTGDDLDEAAVRLVVDATSPLRPRRADSGDDDRDLFGFESTKVRRLRVGVYEAQGSLALANGKQRPMTMVVETPPAHTAFFGLSFVAERADLDESWHELIDTAAGASAATEGGEQELTARAWLRTPVLAAA